MSKATRAIVIMAGLALVGRAPAVAAQGDISVLLGQKSLAEDRLDEAEVDSPIEFGLMLNLDFDWPVSVALDLLLASDDAAIQVPASYPLTIATDVDTMEFHFGVRRIFRKDQPFRVYAGAGAAWSRLDVKQVESGSFGPGADFSDTVVDDGGSGLGYWIDAGLLYRFQRFQLGADVRYSDASVEVTPVGADDSLDLDSGGLHAAVFAGWAW